MEKLLTYASEIHAVDYFGLIIVVSILEHLIPKRTEGEALRRRWAGNIAVTIIDTFMIRAVFPVLGLGVAALCAERGWGLFNLFSAPLWLETVLTLLMLDAVLYVQHYMLHHIPLLWRLHLMHHTDLDFDFTTGLRFHPLESILTTATNLAAIAALGSAPVAVLIAQLAFTFVGIAGHGNLRIPSGLERLARLVFVTPDTHRVHHSADVSESQSNFGNLFSCWDRLVGTYVAEPRAGHEQMQIGVAEFSDPKHLTLPWMLAQPFLPIKPVSLTDRVKSAGLPS